MEVISVIASVEKASSEMQRGVSLGGGTALSNLVGASHGHHGPREARGGTGLAATAAAAPLGKIAHFLKVMDLVGLPGPRFSLPAYLCLSAIIAEDQLWVP